MKTRIYTAPAVKGLSATMPLVQIGIILREKKNYNEHPMLFQWNNIEMQEIGNLFC